MTNLEDVVRGIIEDFMKNNVLFTALDVSNAVKAQMPFVKHRDTRDLVRQLFTTDIEPQNWTRTPITVNLSDGSAATALLYHPLSDSFDLDTKYDAQRRSQVSKANTSAITAPVSSVPPTPVSTVSVSVAVAVSPAQPVSAHDAWDQLFDNQPSLFPNR